MAANMQHMAGAGQMMPQQLRKPMATSHIQQLVFQNLSQNMPPNGLSWQSNVPLSDRMGKTLDLISNITLAMGNIDYGRATEFGLNFEREVFHKSQSKEAYDQAMANKTLDFFKKRQQNEPNIQNALNANAQMQAAHAQAQAQALMQAQMGRGGGQNPQSFQHIQHPMQTPQIPQQQQPEQPQQAQQLLLQQQQQQMAMGMGNQAGRGMGPNPQAMGMPGGPNRPMLNEMARLTQTDKNKVMELASKMMAQTTDQQKAGTRMLLQSKLTAQQLAEFQAQGRDPLVWWFQNQAFQTLKQTSINRFQQTGGPPNQNNTQAAMMQQQHSQQSLQQRQGMMNGAQAAGPTPDFAQFNPNMESIKDQQLNGLMAQQAGLMVVPVSNGAARNATPQPANQNIPNQQVQNQTPRAAQQQQQQAKINQAAQQSQAQLQAQAQMKQMQSQQQMAGGIPTSQSPGMNTLNTPVSRPSGNMNPMGAQGMAQGGIQFGDQRFNQGIQRPNNQVFNNMLANMTPEQRQTINGLPPDKLNEVMRRWQSQRQEQMAMNGSQMMPNQMANRPQNQFGQMAANMAGAPGPQGMPQPNPTGAGNPQQPMQMGRMPVQNNFQQLMDSMELPANVVGQIGQLPLEVKKWKDLKQWINQNNALPPNVRSQLATIQQKQFQMAMQHRRASMPQQAAQNPNMNPAMATAPPGSQMPNQQQPGVQRPMGNIPPQFLQVSPQEMMHIRAQKPSLANVPDEHLRQMILQMKRNTWQAQQLPPQQQQQLRAQQQAQAAQLAAQNQQQPGLNPMAGTQGPVQLQQPPQPNRTPQPQAQPAPNAMGQTAIMQVGGQKQQPNTTPDQNQARNNRPQPPKNLKRPNPDDATDVVSAKPAGPAPRPASQPNQQPQQQQAQQKPTPQFPPQLTPQQEAALTPEQRARYEQMKMQQFNKTLPGAGSEALNRLKMIGQEEQKQFAQEIMPDVPMPPQELAETGAKLKKMVVDMSKVGRGLSRWYALTRDDARARMFFRTRLRLIRQFVDGESMSVLKDTFSIRSSELDQTRGMLESMVKDLAMFGRNMVKPGGQVQQQQQQQQQQQSTPQAQVAQITQQQPQPQQKPQTAQPAPLNAANLEKNTQALNKMNQQKATAKANQVPPAPTTTQPPFPFGATSPHGNPSYAGKQKDINLQLPPARKKQKVTGQSSGQTPQAATPSPQISKNGSPDMRRVQAPPKPVFVCTESDCDMSTIGFPNEQALQNHVVEEHTKPKEDPIKFVQENLALALGLEPDGTVKKDQRLSEVAPAMSVSTSKQGLTPGNLGGTPMSLDGTAMKRSGSAMNKTQDGKSGLKTDATPKAGDGKQMEVVTTMAPADPWASSTIDPQTLLQNLGFENGLPNIVAEANMYRSFTPKDTPGSSKDSGSSEPNSDISESAALDIDMNWQHVDTDLLLDFTHASLENNGLASLEGANGTLDPTLLLDTSGVAPDWDDLHTDFSKPFQFDTRFYSMDTS